MRQLLGGKVHGEIAIEPPAFAIGGEKVALDPATAGDIFGFAQEAGDGMIGREAFLGNRPADRLRIVGLPARRQALPCRCLPLTVAGRAIGLATSSVISPAASAAKIGSARSARRRRPCTWRTVTPKRRATASASAPPSTMSR
jgi:hypothetical protein